MDQNTFTPDTIDKLLMSINVMYLSVYTTMLVEILFFFAYIRALQSAFFSENRTFGSTKMALDASEIDSHRFLRTSDPSMTQQTLGISQRQSFQAIQHIFGMLKCTLIGYTILILPMFVYMLTTFLVANKGTSFKDISSYVDEFNRYHQQYFKCTGNHEVDVVLHVINMLILQIFLQAPFTYIMWPRQNMLKLYFKDRQLWNQIQSE